MKYDDTMFLSFRPGDLLWVDPLSAMGSACWLDFADHDPEFRPIQKIVDRLGKGELVLVLHRAACSRTLGWIMMVLVRDRVYWINARDVFPTKDMDP